MKRLALLLALACAGPERIPSTYAQGAPMPPRPPPFNPAQDAPHTVGQPGHLAPPVRPQPNPVPGRVLPQTPETRREPGIWASDGAPKPKVHFVPYLPQSVPLVPDAELARCARDVVRQVGQEEARQALKLTEPERHCARVLVVVSCLQRWRDLAYKDTSREWVMISMALHGLVQPACSGGPDTREMRSVRDAVLRAQSQ